MMDKITYRFLQMKAEEAFAAGEWKEALRWTKMIDTIMTAMNPGKADGEEHVM